MIIDIHNHTTKYSPCSLISPASLIEIYLESGIDGICITEHNYLWSEDEQAALVEKYRGLINIFFGVEVNTSVGHVLVFGSDRKYYDDYMRIERLLNLVDRDKTALIWAHPFRWESLYQFNVTERFLKKFDAVEIYNGNLTEGMIDYAKEKLSVYDIKLSGGSDTHSIDMAVKYATQFETSIETLDELVHAIKNTQYTPVMIRDEKVL